jgi:DNA-binding transcriptional regulator YbjK
MIAPAAGTLIGMAYASAIDTNERKDLVQSWRRADRNLIDANRDEDSWRS